MIVNFEQDKLKNRDNVIIADENGKFICRGIYDFSYKHRSRIYDESDNEIAYVDGDVSSEKKKINFCDNQDNVIGSLDDNIVNPEGWIVKKVANAYLIENILIISDNKMEVLKDNYLFKAILVLFALVERERL